MQWGQRRCTEQKAESQPGQVSLLLLLLLTGEHRLATTTVGLAQAGVPSSSQMRGVRSLRGGTCRRPHSIPHDRSPVPTAESRYLLEQGELVLLEEQARATKTFQTVPVSNTR